MVTAGACVSQSRPQETPTASDVNTAEKIELDLDALDTRGLQGPPDGLRSMAYEFCIPADDEHVREPFEAG